MYKRILFHSVLVKILLKVFLLLFIGCFSYIGFIYLTGNIHTVIPGEVFRSGQLTGTKLKTVLKKNCIRSIIDLAPAGDKYAQELNISRSMNVQHFDLHLSAYQFPSVENLKALTVLLQTAQRPLLIHCKGGADRTGLASAMMLILTGNKNISKIKNQYSILYGVLYPNSIGVLVMDQYFSWLAQQKLQTSPAHFLYWLNHLELKK